VRVDEPGRMATFPNRRLARVGWNPNGGDLTAIGDQHTIANGWKIDGEEIAGLKASMEG